jgi:2-dehydro-3-deoxyphosphogluconate aldolase / (4S)-4-hydroxy-2-oxoglutarate aldolase
MAEAPHSHAEPPAAEEGPGDLGPDDRGPDDLSPGELTRTLRGLGVIPVVVIRDPLRATPLANALIAGGLPCAEITLRTPGAMESLRRIAGEVPGLLLGAGTVLTPEQALESFDAGARFIVSPGFSPRVVECCLSHGIPVFPGVCTPTEVTLAIDHGLDTLKFFPAEPMGGASFLRAIAAPFPEISWIPTGGVGLAQLAGYLEMDGVLACGGSWIAPASWIETGAFDRIRIEAENARAAVLGVPRERRSAISKPPQPGS